jgi:hypothetical protein
MENAPGFISVPTGFGSASGATDGENSVTMDQRTTAIGTFGTSRDVRRESAIRTKADVRQQHEFYEIMPGKGDAASEPSSIAAEVRR